MTQAAPPRTTQQRVLDTRARLESDVDAWVATAGPTGPWLVPLSFDWDGRRLLFATDANSPTVRNVSALPRVRVALGVSRDVALVDGTAEAMPINQLSDEAAARYQARAGSDPRTWATVLLAVTPERIQAWREENELAGRTIMRDGQWLA